MPQHMEGTQAGVVLGHTLSTEKIGGGAYTAQHMQHKERSVTANVMN